MNPIETFEGLLAKGQDNAMLRFGLGSAYLKEKRAEPAVAHLRKAVEHDPEYSAAWKLLGKALAGCDDAEGAAEAYRRGIAAAERKGDIQAAKEMKVFLKRVDR